MRDKSTGLLDVVNAFVRQTPFPLHVARETAGAMLAQAIGEDSGVAGAVSGAVVAPVP